MTLLRHTSVISGLLLMAAATCFAGDYDAQSMAMGGVGIASTGMRDGALRNPALAAYYNKNEYLSVDAFAGLIAADDKDVLDNADDSADLLNALNGQIPTAAEADELASLLLEMDQATFRYDGGAGLQVTLINKAWSLVFFAQSHLSLGGTAIVDDADIQYLIDASDNSTAIDKNDLNSLFVALGAEIYDVGISLAGRHRVSEDVDFSFGFSPKWQTLETYHYVTPLADFNSSDYDANDYTSDESTFNADVGVYGRFGQHWKVGAVIRDVFQHDFQTVFDETITINPKYTLGGAYQNHWVTAEIDVDLRQYQDLVTRSDVQLFRAGIQFRPWDWLQLRLGYREDIQNELESTFSAGFGISPYDFFNIDLAVLSGDGGTLGGALQIGVYF